MARMFLRGYLQYLENVCYEILPFMFEKKLDRARQQPCFYCITAHSLMADQVRSLRISEGLYALLNGIT